MDLGYIILTQRITDDGRRAGLEGELKTRGFHPKLSVPLMGPLAWTTQFRLLGMTHLLRRIPLAK